MALFKNIPHISRKVYAHTFLNEIVLFFAYNPVKMGVVGNDIMPFLSERGYYTITRKTGNVLICRDGNAIVTFMSSGVLVSIPSKEYHDFTTTGCVWEHLEEVLNRISVEPMVWTFSKSNRFIFNTPIRQNEQDAVFKLVLSKELIECSADNHLYVSESEDKTCVFSCQYVLGHMEDKDSLVVKNMLLSSSYSLSNLKEQVMSRNDDMFDCWHWCMSENVLQLMDSKQMQNENR